MSVNSSHKKIYHLFKWPAFFGKHFLFVVLGFALF